MLNPSPDKAFEDYKKQINKEAFYKGLKYSFKNLLNGAIEKLFALVSLAYLFVVAYIIAHFVIKFW